MSSFSRAIPFGWTELTATTHTLTTSRCRPHFTCVDILLLGLELQYADISQGQDVAYTYYNGASASVLSTPIAIALQEYITQFAISGQPNEPGVPYFSMYGNNATVQDLNITGITQVMDPTANQRCNWWQKVLYV